VRVEREEANGAMSKLARLVLIAWLVLPLTLLLLLCGCGAHRPVKPTVVWDMNGTAIFSCPPNCYILLSHNSLSCEKEKKPVKPIVSAPPNFEGKCAIGEQYNHWSQKCEKYPSEGTHGCGVEVVQADGSTWVTPCWPESKWKKPYCVNGCK
jgi:hypothetical protein